MSVRLPCNWDIRRGPEAEGKGRTLHTNGALRNERAWRCGDAGLTWTAGPAIPLAAREIAAGARALNTCNSRREKVAAANGEPVLLIEPTEAPRLARPATCAACPAKMRAGPARSAAEMACVRIAPTRTMDSGIVARGGCPLLL